MAKQSGRASSRIREPSILVRPISRFGGLDNIHVALIALVVILMLLLVAVSYNTKITVYNATAPVSGQPNQTSPAPVHTSAQVRMQAERILAGYADANSSLAIIPYIADVNSANVSYIPATRQWYVSVPYTSPINRMQYAFSMTISDTNLSSFSTMVQAAAPASVSQSYVATEGVIQMAGQTSCASGSPVQVYWFIDPYAPGSLQSLSNATAMQREFGSGINLSVKILFTQYSQQIADTYGTNSTDQLGRYLLCASEQDNFTGFVNAVNATYQYRYMPAYTLQQLAGQSGMNVTRLDSCVASSQSAINAQAVQAKYYGIASPSAVVTDCEYLSIPQTARNAVCYADSSLC